MPAQWAAFRAGDSIRIEVAYALPLDRLRTYDDGSAVMLDAGLPLVQCLEILGGQEDHKVFKKIIDDVRSDVDNEET